MSEVSVARRVMADQVKEHLLDKIVQGHYPPDSRIVEMTVAKEMGTSQAPVREALRGLEAMGVIELVPFRGARVRGFSERSLMEAYTVRCSLESLAAQLAVPALTDEDLSELSDLYHQMQAAADSGDAHQLAAADAEFHRCIVELSGNETLVRMWRSLEPLSRTYLTLVVPGANPQWTAHLHTPILDALVRRDANDVVHALVEHFDQARGMLLAELSATVVDGLRSSSSIRNDKKSSTAPSGQAESAADGTADAVALKPTKPRRATAVPGGRSKNRSRTTA